MLKEKIQQLAKQNAPDFIAIRHHLHAHPELSYQEFQTSAFVQEKIFVRGDPLPGDGRDGSSGHDRGQESGQAGDRAAG